MPLVPLDISKGLYENIDSGGALPPYAPVLKNILVNEGGHNIDRPGLSTFTTIGSSPVIGQKYFKLAEKIVAVTEDRQIFSINSTGTVAQISGTNNLGGTNRPVFEEDGTYLAIAGGGAPQRWPGSGNTELMPGSPENTNFISYLDGYWLSHLIGDQEIRWAGPTAATRATWNTADFFQAEGLPDTMVSQAVNLRQFFAFGETSVEIFQNYGDSSVPFRRSFFFDKGVAAPYSVVKADNTLFWLDSLRRFVRLESNTPTQKSGAIQKTIDRLSTVSDCWGANIKIDSYDLIAWTFPTEGRTFVLNILSGEWDEWDGFENGQSQIIPMHSYTFSDDWNSHFVGDPGTGVIYKLGFDYKTDASRNMRRLRRTGKVNHGTYSRKRSNYYLIDVKQGVGTNGQTEPTFQIRVNDDDNGWTDPVDVPLGFPGNEQEPIRVSELGGIYRTRQMEISFTGGSEFLLRGIQEDVEAMNS